MIPRAVCDRFRREVAACRGRLKHVSTEFESRLFVRYVLQYCLGWDRLDITDAFLQDRFCDLALTFGDSTVFVIEVEAVERQLDPSDLGPSIECCQRVGCGWIIHTNSVLWRVYRLESGAGQLAYCFSFADLDPANEEHQENLFAVSKEGRERLPADPYSIAELLRSEEVAAVVQAELRRRRGGVPVALDTVRAAIRGVLNKEYR